MAKKSTKTSRVAGRSTKISTLSNSQSSKIIYSVTAKNPGQKEALRTIAKNDISILSGPPGTGKAQPFSSLVYCPDGPIEMKDVKVGTRICTPDGKTALVSGVFPQGVKDVY